MNRVREFLRAFKPGPGVRKGAMWASALFVLPYWAYFGSRARIGFGPVLDWIAWGAAAIILLFLGAAVAALVLVLARKLPPFATGFVVTAAAMIALPWPAPWIGALLALAVAAFGGLLVSLVAGWGEMEETKKAVTVILLVVTAGAVETFAYFLYWDGTTEGLVKAAPSQLPSSALLSAPDPSDPGNFPVGYLTYGTGKDKRRSEYAGGAALKTRTVDGSRLLKDVEGWKGKYLKWYWGFGTKELPLNARLWYPRGNGPFPLILIVHGNHLAQEASEPGYEYLGRLFASRGYLFASIDENFLNSAFAANYDLKETAARGWLLLEHLKLWREWNSTKGHVFEGKVDLERIGLIGHSRGGEAVATASEFNRLKNYPGDANQKFDYGFNIKGLIAIAPADGQYKPAGMPRKIHDVSYLTVHGSHDFDVSNFDGAKQYQRTILSEGSTAFKAYLYIYRANHGQFNTVWDRHDWSPPGIWLMNLHPLLRGEEQRKIALVYFSAFMDAALKGRAEYLPLFEDARRGARWLPPTIYVNRYDDASYRPVAGFDEDYDVTSATMPGASLQGENLAVWREQRIGFRRGERDDNGVYLGWRKGEKASYTVNLPPDLKLDPAGILEFALSGAGEDPPKKDDASGKNDKEEKKDKPAINLSIELVARDGTVRRALLSDMGPIYPPLTVKHLKVTIPGFDPYRKNSEPVPQRYSLALKESAATLQKIRFVFDQTPEGVVVADDIGFSRAR